MYRPGFNKTKILKRPQTAFSAKIEKTEKFLLETPIKLRERKQQKAVEPEIPKEKPEIKIEEEFLNLKKDESIFYKSCYDPNNIRFVQILKDGHVVENYTIEFVDAYTTKITANEELSECQVRIYFFEPAFVGVLEKVLGPAIEKSDISNRVYEWDVASIFDDDKWEQEIYNKNIGEPFIGGLYTIQNFKFTLQDKNNVEHIFENTKE